MTARSLHRRSDLPCPNPFCDGYGDIDISPGITGRSRAVGACKVGPHPLPHPLSEGRRRVVGSSDWGAAWEREAAIKGYPR